MTSSEMARRRRTAALPVLVALGLLLNGCGGDSPDTLERTDTAGTAGTSNSAGVDPAPRRIDVTIAGDQITPKPGTVEVTEGQSVVLTLTSDKNDEVHVHGIDQTLEVMAGTPGILRFTATAPGSYEVEMHESGKLLFNLQVKPAR